MKDIKLIVTGGRFYQDSAHVRATLTLIHEHIGIAHLYEGAAGGADKFAWFWRQDNKVDGKRFPANWEGPCRETCRPNHRRFPGENRHSTCPAAGIYRNHDMYDAVNPDLVVAFPGGKGTGDMMGYAFGKGTIVLKMTATHTRELPHEVWTPLGMDTPDFSWL